MSGIDLRQTKVRSGHFRGKGDRRWDGTRTLGRDKLFHREKPGEIGPLTPTLSPGGLGEGERWDGIDRNGTRAMGNALPNEKRSPTTTCWWWGSVRA